MTLPEEIAKDLDYIFTEIKNDSDEEMADLRMKRHSPNRAKSLRSA